jgi:hypothetical protein
VSHSINIHGVKSIELRPVDYRDFCALKILVKGPKGEMFDITLFGCGLEEVTVQEFPIRVMAETTEEDDAPTV